MDLSIVSASKSPLGRWWRARTRTAHLLGSTLDAWACSPVPGESGIAHNAALFGLQAGLLGNKRMLWQKMARCQPETPIYYKYYV